MTDVQKALEYVRANRERFVAEMKEFLTIPSISTLDENKADVQRAAEWDGLRPDGGLGRLLQTTTGDEVPF